MNTLTKAIRKTTGLSMRRFVEDRMGIKYMTFLYRYKQGVLRLEDYHVLSYHTGMTFEQLFPSPYKVPKRLQRIILTPPSGPPVNKAELIQELAQNVKQPKKKSYSASVARSPEPRNGVQKNNLDDELPFLDVHAEVDLDE
jgi:hypothetical protein